MRGEVRNRAGPPQLLCSRVGVKLWVCTWMNGEKGDNLQLDQLLPLPEWPVGFQAWPAGIRAWDTAMNMYVCVCGGGGE